MQITGILWVVFFLTFPIALNWLCANTKIFKAIGSVLLAYIVGITIGNFPAFGLEQIAVPATYSQPITGLSIFFAIPLFLITTDFRAWLVQAGPAARAFGLSCACAILATAALAVISQIPGSPEIGGMMVGAATGGTVNLAAVGYAMGTDPALLVVVNTGDTLIGGIYLLFVMRLAKPLLTKWLKPFPYAVDTPQTETAIAKVDNHLAGFEFSSFLKAFGVALGLVTGSYGLAMVGMAISRAAGLPDEVVSEMELPFVMIFLTPLSVAASFIKSIRGLRISERMGDYAILVFALSFGSMVDITALQISNIEVLSMSVGIVLFATVLYYLLCKPFGIDRDTAIIVGTATIMSPPFISAVAESIGNKRVILTGLTTGIVGYALGTFLGIGTTLLLRVMLG